MAQQTIIQQIRALANGGGSALRETVDGALSQLPGLEDAIGKGPWDRVHVIGCGTSYYAAMVCEHVFEELAGVPTFGSQAFDFLAYRNAGLLGPRSLVAAFSTAGDTVAPLRSLEKARAGGARTVAVTAVSGSPVSLASHATLLTGATDEVSVPRTKGQLQGLLSLYMLAASLGRSGGRLTREGFEDVVTQIRLAVDAIVSAVGTLDGTMQELAQTYRRCGAVFVVGTGPNLGTAHTGALMITEMAKIHALGDGTENFLHGRDREFDPSDPVFVLAPRGAGSARTLDFLTVSSHTMAPTVVFTDAPDADMKRLSTRIVQLPGGIRETFTPLVYLIPLLLFANHLAVALGEDPNKRRHLDIVPSKMKFVPQGGAR